MNFEVIPAYESTDLSSKTDDWLEFSRSELTAMIQIRSDSQLDYPGKVAVMAYCKAFLADVDAEIARRNTFVPMWHSSEDY